MAFFKQEQPQNKEAFIYTETDICSALMNVSIFSLLIVDTMNKQAPDLVQKVIASSDYAIYKNAALEGNEFLVLLLETLISPEKKDEMIHNTDNEAFRMAVMGAQRHKKNSVITHLLKNNDILTYAKNYILEINKIEAGSRAEQYLKPQLMYLKTEFLDKMHKTVGDAQVPEGETFMNDEYQPTQTRGM